MLERLFGTKTRVKLLKLFLLHPGEKFSFSQISKDLRILPAPLKKELDNLEKFGMVISSNQLPLEGAEAEEAKNTATKQKEAKFEKRNFEANPNFILHHEIKDLVIRAQLLYERDFIDKLVKLGRVKLLILTGLFVNSDTSPIDLLIVGQVSKSRLVKLLHELERELGKEINFTFFETAEFIYRRNMTDVFLYEILEGKKIVIVDELNS